MIATLLRKPIKKTVAQNALENGCGGLNIDATRVGYSDSENIDFNAKQRQQADPEEKGWSGHVAKVGTEIQMHKEKGRWSANFVLKHEPNCELKGTKKIKSSSGRGAVKKKSSAENLGNQGSSYSKESRKEGSVMICHVDEDGNEEVSNWTCMASCPVEKLDSQFKEASRYFKQVTNFNDLLDYLATLITPPKEIESTVFVGDSDEFLESTHEKLHGAVIVGEFSKEESENLFSYFLPGSHLIVIPYESYNAQTVVHLEDSGFEVRDSIFIPEKEDFMYAKKASKKEREKGLDVFEEKIGGGMSGTRDKTLLTGSGNERSNLRKNTHPTVKPIQIMEWCLRDIPKDTIVLDPFMGSGTTGIAAVKKGHLFVGMEINQEYLEIASARLKRVKNES